LPKLEPPKLTQAPLLFFVALDEIAPLSGDACGYLRSTSAVPPEYLRSTSVPESEVLRRYSGGTTEVLRRYPRDGRAKVAGNERGEVNFWERALSA
jgi:hypothetical protein